ncbi:hypothetical protein Tco_0612377 [Tanacetum coccineum]
MNMLNRNCKTSFAKPEFLKKAQRANPHLYDIGCYNDNLALMLAPDSDEMIHLEKERRSKLSDLIRPFDYDQLNNLYDLYYKDDSWWSEDLKSKTTEDIISIGSFVEVLMSTLAEFMIVVDADNRPPMLDKLMYESWNIRMELYIQGKDHGWIILNSVENGPLIWPTVELENGTVGPKTYEELSDKEKLQADCNLKATNIVLQGLPLDVYPLVNHHKVSKEIWDRVKLLMQGTSLSKKERECKLYDEFDKFSHVKGETFLPPEWGKFVTVVKLARDLHTSNYDQLYAYLEQHEEHANEARLMHERFPDPLALVANYH